MMVHIGWAVFALFAGAIIGLFTAARCCAASWADAQKPTFQGFETNP